MKRKILILGALLLSLICMCAGCGKKVEDEKNISLVIIAGKHANACMYNDTIISNIKPLIRQSVKSEKNSDGTYWAKANIEIIVSDGKPVKESLDESHLWADASNRSIINSEKNDITDYIVDYLKSDELRAKEEEVDLLQSIYVAKTVLDEMDTGLEKHILILDTGFTTSGYFNMRNIPIREGEVSDVISKIDEGGIPDLSDVYVTFMGIGNVAGEQKTGNIFTERLIDVWTGIIEGANGTIVNVDGKKAEIKRSAPGENDVRMIYDEGDVNSYPLVSCVKIPSEISDAKRDEGVTIVSKPTNGDNEVPGVADGPGGCPVPSSEFIPDTSTIRDVTYVRNILIDFLKDYKQDLEDPAVKIYVVGSIAKVNPDGNFEHHELSRDRAAVIASMLIEASNLSEDRIVPIDAGTHAFSWRKEDFKNGVNIPENQQENRSVRIICDTPANQDNINELKAAGYIK